MTTWEENAAAFAELDAGEGWPFAILVACSVEKGTAAHRPPVTTVTGGKVSAREFAEAAGTSAPRVLRYLEAWEAHADHGAVPRAADLTPDHAPTFVPPGIPWASRYAPVGGGRDYPSQVARGIERHGAVTVVNELSPEVRREVAQAIAQAEVFDAHAAIVGRGGVIPERKAPEPSSLDPIILTTNLFERASAQMGQVFRLLEECPALTEHHRERVRQWAVGLMDHISATEVAR